MLTFTGLAALLVPVFVVLGFWQWDRFEQRLAATQLQEENIAAEEVAFDELTEVDGDLAPDDRWHSTTLTGEFDPDHEVLVRNRTSDDGPGFFVVTPLLTGDGTAALVNRGWVPRAEAADARPEVPPPPTGNVTVTGRAETSETTESTGIQDRDGLPEGQVMLIDVPTLAEEMPYPVLGGHIEMLSLEPAVDETPLPVTVDGYNWGLNLAYAVQWWLFAALVVGALVVLVRREVREAREGTNDAPGRDGREASGADGGADAPSVELDGERAS
ncbi:SURF1 family protein [Spiractinospora alimapuensis]|nr:SURF1 family protein [Spiractinospora alimapuensis]